MRAAWQMWRGNTGLTEEIVNKIIDTGVKNVPTHASIGDEGGNERLDTVLRSSKVSWITHEKWIRDILFEHIKTANKNEYLGKIFTIPPYELISLE